MAARPWGFKSPLPHQAFFSLMAPKRNFLLINPWIYDFAAYDLLGPSRSASSISPPSSKRPFPAGSTSSTASTAPIPPWPGTAGPVPTAGAPFPKRRSPSPPSSGISRGASRATAFPFPFSASPWAGSRVPDARLRDVRDDLLVPRGAGSRRPCSGEVRTGARHPRGRLRDPHARSCPPALGRRHRRRGAGREQGPSDRPGNPGRRPGGGGGISDTRSDAPSGVRPAPRQDLPPHPDVPRLSLSVLVLRRPSAL